MEIGEAGNENELNRGRSNKEYNCMAQCHGLVEYISSRQPDRENAMKCRRVKHYIDKNTYNNNKAHCNDMEDAIDRDRRKF